MHQFRNDTLKHVFFQNFEFVTLAGRLWPEGGILNYNRVCLAALPDGLLEGANWQTLPGMDRRLRWLRPQEIVQGTRPTSSDLHV